MLRLLCPQWVFDNYEAVTPEFLKEHGVKLLLADLDFTLAPKSQSEPDESLTRWIGALKEAGIEFAILSNNRSPVRVEKFCKPLKVGYVGHAGKPGTRGFHEAMARYGIASLSPLKRWCRLYREGGAEALRPRPKGRPRGSGAGAAPMTREQELEREVRRLEAEVAYLKKSMALKAELRSRTGRRP